MVNPKLLIVGLALALLSGCFDTPAPAVYVHNQCLRRELFTQCLQHLPVGPVTVGHNDWGKVVDMCGDISRDQSLVLMSTVPVECRGP